MAISARTVFLLGIGVYFLSAVLPAAITNFFNADTTGWDAGTVALWSLIPLAIIGLLVMKYVPGGSKSE